MELRSHFNKTMALTEDKFLSIFLNVLSNGLVVKKLQEVIVSPLEVDIKNLKDSNKKLLKEIESLHNKDTELRQKVSRLEEKLDAKDKDLLALRNKNAELDKKLDDQEQYSRRNTLRLQGLPELKDEDLPIRFRHLAMTRLNTEMEALDIDSIHRVGDKKQNAPRDILIKFTTHQARRVIFKARNDLRKPGKTPQEFDPEIETEDSQDDQLYEADINQRGIFINEDLTRKRSNLLWKARQMKKEKKINDCWSYDGKVMVKTLANKIELISSAEDFNSY